MSDETAAVFGLLQTVVGVIGVSWLIHTMRKDSARQDRNAERQRQRSSTRITIAWDVGRCLTCGATGTPVVAAYATRCPVCFAATWQAPTS